MAQRFGLAPTTLHSHISSGRLPAKLYRASCELAAEKGMPMPALCLFGFAPLRNEVLSEASHGDAA